MKNLEKGLAGKKVLLALLIFASICSVLEVIIAIRTNRMNAFTPMALIFTNLAIIVDAKEKKEN